MDDEGREHGMVAAQVDERWRPPPPHWEKLLEYIARGHAHIQEQGHGKPPLVSFFDGGVMALPRVRHLKGMRFVADAAPGAGQRATQFSDICGAIDELERLAEQEPTTVVAQPEHVGALLDDVGHMFGRLVARREQYGAFADRLQEVVDRMRANPAPDVPPCLAALAGIRADLLQRSEATLADPAALRARLEAVRDVANESEQTLHRCRALAMEVARLYDDVRGGRVWDHSAAASPASPRT